MTITLGQGKSHSYYNSWDIITRILIVCISFTLMPVTSYAQLQLIKSIRITESTEGGSARPEIVSAAERVFVIYLGNISSGNNRTFNLKIFNKDLDTVVLSKILVSTTEQFGGPTDIRIASDGQYLYAFYETNKPTSPATATTYLWAAKYTLNDNFDRVAYTMVPITNSKPMAELQDGGELVDDPAPLIGPTSVFVVTRLKYSLAIAGKTIYRVREFSKNDLTKLSDFDLDLSNAPGIDGRGRVCSLIYFNEHYYIALPTTVSDIGIVEAVDPSAISNIALVKLDTNWKLNSQTDVKIISAEPDDKEFYVSGLNTDGNYFYVTYVQIASGAHMAILNVFDMNYNLIQKFTVKNIVALPGGGEIRPSLEVRENRIFSGQSAGESIGSGNAEIILYEKIATSVDGNDSPLENFSLSQNYPNPFNPTTVISYQLPMSSYVTLKVFDVLGREVATLVEGELNLGEHSVAFDATNLSSSIYFYQLRARSYIQTKKMLVTK
ncbi:hypothetical protein C0389_05705 [bacterium]|nr:hypothetical protein [bacterium]